MLLILARAVHIGASLLLFGLVFFERAVLPPDRSLARFRHRLDLAVGVVAVLALISGAFWFVLAAANMAGDDPWYTVGAGDLGLVMTQTRFGWLWLGRGAVLGMMLILLVAFRRFSKGRGLLLFLAALVAGSMAWAGHAGADSTRPWHLVADVLHLLVAGIWPLGLFPLAALLISARAEPAAVAAVRQFSHFALPCVLVLLASGWVNSWYLVGSWDHLFHTDYGRELLVKLAAFALMIALGARNRFVLARADGPPRILATVLLETILALVIIGIVGAMGAIAPPG